MVSTEERQNLTDRTAITFWKRRKIFRRMLKPLKNQSKSIHPIDQNMKEAAGGMNIQAAFVNSTWLVFIPHACDMRVKRIEICIKETEENIWAFDTFSQLSRQHPSIGYIRKIPMPSTELHK